MVLKTIDLLAGGATPIILISLGIFLARGLPKSIEYKHVIGLIGLKLIVMPLAITPFILGELYPMERELIAFSIVISCVLAVFTLPLIMVLVGVVYSMVEK